MDLGLKGKTALVLGAGGGLGRAISLALAGEGVKVAMAGIHLASVDETAAALSSLGAQGMSLEWDISNLAIIDDCLSRIERTLGPVDILVNNTGGPPPTPAEGQDPALWTKSFEQMVLSVIAITDRVLPGMRVRKWGRVITSTSSGVVSPIPNLGMSNALRLALVGWSKTLAREVGGDGVTANVILPGRIATPRITFLDEQKAKREGRAAAEVAAESMGAIPVGRYGRPEEYGDAVAFLASQKASYITGSVIRVDGGLIASI
jgi:3-oxoacyl-[acyl-carrier protein] reductase